MMDIHLLLGLPQAVIFTDALVVLQALKGANLPHQRIALGKISVRKQVIMHCVPPHRCVSGNGSAEDMSKKKEYVGIQQNLIL